MNKVKCNNCGSEDMKIVLKNGLMCNTCSEIYEVGFTKQDDITTEDINRAKEFVIKTRKASINALQDEMQIGFNKSLQLMEELEKMGVVSKKDGTEARSVLI